MRGEVLFMGLEQMWPKQDVIVKIVYIFFLKNQQFITWSMQADCGSYFITMYNRSRQTWNRE